MKRMAGVLVGAIVMALSVAGTALADYTNSPSPTTVVSGSGGGTAFTGGNVSTPLVVASILVIVGLAALFVARRRATHAA
jgi:hypothetical protein